MARTSPWPTLLGTAALIALPVLAAAQSGQASGAGSPQPQTPKAQSDTSYPVGSGAATQHLTEAKQVLDGIPRNAVTGRNASKLNQIRREFAALQRSYSANPSASTTKSSSARGAKSAAGNWNTQLMALDRDLTALLGRSSGNTATETSSAGSTSSTETTGTSGSSTPGATAGNSSSASSSLDPNVRSQLEEFRKHVTAFAAAASGTEPGGEMSSSSSTGSASSMSSSAAASTTPSSTTPTEPTETSPTGSSSSQSNPTSSKPSSSSPAQTGSATGETAQAQSGQATSASGAQSDANVARQHLTEARQSLADLTALPQAQQLQGDVRTQVSQLISQFNQLITTQDDWRASYEQVNSTLTTLLSHSSASSTPTQGSTSSTQGAVGTSGAASASGAASLDPALRAKLEEFRTHLQAFYESAGGNSTAASTTSSTGSSASTSSTGAMGSTGSTPSSAEAESHIDAIERILDQAGGGSSSSTASSTGTSGSTGSTTSGSTGAATGSGNTTAANGSSVTLTQQQIDQIRMHLQQLRSSIKK